ncbi:hypothetical protein [Marinobacter goseongensis]|uniref:hypothetical protein n=1 Tax=Marinobacter goseongensis TaxID=453838 RepID=UPI00200696A3|nr:hypothetical protein [Marinobacter goseongensis]MCK7550849.1 hypothetical protein [Marinobacter goseongensis]
MHRRTPAAVESPLFKGLLGAVVVLLGLMENAKSQENTESREVVEWLAPYFPPFHKHPDRGDFGYFDQLHSELIEGLPEYDHRFTQANYSRILYNAKLGRSFCSQALIKTPERAPFFHFSRPIIPMLSQGLIVRTDALPRLPGDQSDPNRPVSLVAVLSSGFGPIGYLKHRTYSKPVDDLLRTYEEDNPENTDLYGSARTNEVLAGMLLTGRLVAILGTASEVDQLTPDQKASKAFTFRPLTETPEYSQLHYACTRDDRGRDIIELLNVRFTELKVQSRAKELYQSTLSGASAERYESVYQRFMAR